MHHQNCSILDNTKLGLLVKEKCSVGKGSVCKCRRSFYSYFLIYNVITYIILYNQEANILYNYTV